MIKNYVTSFSKLNDNSHLFNSVLEFMNSFSIVRLINKGNVIFLKGRRFSLGIKNLAGDSKPLDVAIHVPSDIICIKQSFNFCFFLKYWIHYSRRNAFSIVKESGTTRRLSFRGNSSGISTTSRYLVKNETKSLSKFIKPPTLGF